MNNQNRQGSEEQEVIQGQLFDINESKDGLLPEQRSIDDVGRDELLVSLLAIASIKGIGYKTLRAMNSSGFLEALWRLEHDEILQWWQKLKVKPRTDFSKTISEKRDKLRQIGERSARDLQAKGISFIPLGHADYPAALKRLKEPPQWLFVIGNIGCLHASSIVGVVGTREPTDEGRRVAYRCSKELVDRNLIVLSGLAKGIDETAHRGAVDHYGQTIAILGHGIATGFASTDQKLWATILETEGAIVSEYLPGDPPSRDRFLRRNELQAALSKALIPIECPSLNSGTGATIRRAMALGTPIIGIIPAGSNEQSLLRTKENLEKLEHPVFEIFSSNSHEFWNYLKELIPDHNWEPDPTLRQNRFFLTIEKIVRETKGEVPLDEAAIDRLATRLKNLLSVPSEGGERGSDD